MLPEPDETRPVDEPSHLDDPGGLPTAGLTRFEVTPVEDETLPGDDEPYEG